MSSLITALLALPALAALCAAAPPKGAAPPPPPRYRVVALPERFRVSPSPGALNDRGEVAGYVQTAVGQLGENATDGALWRGGRIVRRWRKSQLTVAVAVNGRGDVLLTAGSESHLPRIEWRARTYLVRAGGGRSVEIAGTDATFSGATGAALNDRGEVVAQPVVESSPAHHSVERDPFGFLRRPDGRRLGLGMERPGDINARSQVVGGRTPPGARFGSEAVLWNSGRLTVLGPGEGVALNARGDALCVMDRSSPKPTRTYVVRRGARRQEFVTLPPGRGDFCGADIDGSGRLVGWSVRAPDSEAAEAYLLLSGGGRSRAHRLADLAPAAGKAGWRLKQGVSINEKGWIVGHGTLRGRERSFLLVPLSR